VLLQRNIKWYQEGRLYSTHNQWHTVGDSQNLLFIDTCILQFHNTANIASLIDSHEHSYETIGTKQWLANRWCRIRTNCIIAAVRIKILPDHKEVHLGVLTEVLGTLGRPDGGSWGTGTFISKRGQPREKWDKWEP